MADFFGTDRVEVTVASGRSLDGVPIPPRTFDQFSHLIKEVIDARVWGGIHFRTADVQGAVIGKKVALYLEKHCFRPVDRAERHGQAAAHRCLSVQTQKSGVARSKLGGAPGFPDDLGAYRRAMPRYRVETFLDPDATVGCTAREWRVRWAAGELRRQGIRVRFDRVLRGPEGRSCLFLFEAASARETALVAELAELDGFRVVEEPRAAALS